MGQQIRLYYHQDLRGTADYLTSPVSQKIESWTHYNEWGELTHNAVLKCGQRELDLVKNYTGHDYDAVLNLYYAKARMYDAENRRFTSLDPIMDGSVYDISEQVTDPMMFTQYLYVKDNPLRWVDPLGLRPVKDDPRESFTTRTDLPKPKDQNASNSQAIQKKQNVSQSKSVEKYQNLPKPQIPSPQNLRTQQASVRAETSSTPVADELRFFVVPVPVPEPGFNDGIGSSVLPAPVPYNPFPALPANQEAMLSLAETVQQVKDFAGDVIETAVIAYQVKKAAEVILPVYVYSRIFNSTQDLAIQAHMKLFGCEEQEKAEATANSTAVTSGDPKKDDDPDWLKKFKEVADKLASRYHGQVENADKGSGYKVKFTIKGKDFIVRLMEHGGQRTAPYIRITVTNLGALTAAGHLSSNLGWTHIVPEPDVFNQIVNIIENFLRFYP